MSEVQGTSSKSLLIQTVALFEVKKLVWKLFQKNVSWFLGFISKN